MLKPVPCANAMAVATALIYLVLGLLAMVSPGSFKPVFNAQFLGADVASLFPRGGLGFVSFLGMLAGIVGMTWLWAFVWAWVYNRLASRA
jgi:hypothetical protein